MCGIVCYVGQSGGLTRVLDALQLLEYRAPDSAGLAALDSAGELAIRRCVGTGRELRARIAAEPLDVEQAQIVVGHGRWAMVGAVTEANAHPISDRSRSRIVVENGSHNASLMLGAWSDQEAWWRQRGVVGPAHHTQNTTEALAYEWERMACLLAEDCPPPGSNDFLATLDKVGINEAEERALRLAVWRLRQGNAHACAFYGRAHPETLYVSSHEKPVAVTIRRYNGGCDLMVASDVNAALMLWPKSEVEEAAAHIEHLRAAGAAPTAIEAVLDRFTVDVIFLDNNLGRGQELFARIDNQRDGPHIYLSRYDGTPITAIRQRLALNPAMAGRRGFPTYTESHIAEIPDVLDTIIETYVYDSLVNMASVWQEERLLKPGLNTVHLQQHFGIHLERLQRLLLVGEGSSWRDAQAAAPLLRRLLPGVLVIVYRPVEMLNLGVAVSAAHALAVEISWSGATDSLLKVDAWLAETGAMRLAVTGRPQSDLARRTAVSGGVLDVRSGVEASVATVKGYQAILMTLGLLAVQLAQLRSEQWAVDSDQYETLAQLIDELTRVIPQRVRAVVADQERREQLRRVAERCRHFNKVAVVGNSPIEIEAELKIEELAQVVAIALDFNADSLRPLIERSACHDADRARTLFIVNVTNTAAQQAARPVLGYLRALKIFHIVHTTPGFVEGASAPLPAAGASPTEYELFVSPQTSPRLQPLIDAPFFFDLAVALAYARGLSPAEIDRPRNLAKSVTTTGAERRTDVEARPEFSNASLARFGAKPATPAGRLPPDVERLARSLGAARGVLAESSLPDFGQADRLVVLTAGEAIENGANMSLVAWEELPGISATVYRRFLHDEPIAPPNTAVLRLVQTGPIPTMADGHTIALPEAVTLLELELLAAVYLNSLAIRLAQQRGADTSTWENGAAQLPQVVAGVLADQELARRVSDILAPFVNRGYDKVQIIGGGQDFISAASIARSLRLRGLMAEALYTDSAWHGPLAAVGGPDADHDALIIILATDPLFQAAALVDTQVYRTRQAPVILVVPQGNENLHAVRRVEATAVLAVPAVPRPFVPLVNAALGEVIARQMN